MSHDFASAARIMAATAKCLEILGPLSVEERNRAIFGLVITTLDEDKPEHKRMIDGLTSKMSAELKR